MDGSDEVRVFWGLYGDGKREGKEELSLDVFGVRVVRIFM